MIEKIFIYYLDVGLITMFAGFLIMGKITVHEAFLAVWCWPIVWFGFIKCFFGGCP